MTEKAIRFSATVAQVKTLADGGIRITLDLGEHEIETATKLMQTRQAGAILEIAAVPVKAKHGRRKESEDSGSSEPTY